VQAEVKKEGSKEKKKMRRAAVVALLFAMGIWFPLSAASLSEFIEKGRVLFSEGKFKEAYFLFAQATRDFPQSALAWYNLGITGYKLGLYKEAAENLKKSAELSKKISPQALYYRGICLWRMKKFSLARRSFEKVVKLSPNSRYGWASSANMGKLRGRRKKWSIFSSVSGEFDNNVNYEPVSVDVSARDKDYKISAIFSGDYRFFKWLSGGYSFYGTEYKEFSNLDFLQHTARISLPVKISKRGLSRFKIKYWSSQLNGENYQSGYKIEERLSFLKKRSNKTEILLAFANRDYLKDEYSYLDGTSYELSLLRVLSAGKWKMSINCGYKKQDAKDNSGMEDSYTLYTSSTSSTVKKTAFFRCYSFDEYEFGIKGKRKIFNNVSFEAAVNYSMSMYKDEDSWFEEKVYYKDVNNNWYEIITTTYTYLEPTGEPTAKTKLRKDRRFSAKVSLTKPISKNFNISLEYSYTDTKSTIGKEDYRDRNYRRSVISASLNLFF